jgi:ABC-type multidrug transport system ATPase subunit
VSQGITEVVIDRVGKTYDQTAALRSVTGRVRAGRLTLIEGPNGSGKSTLLGIIGAVIKPTIGSVRYEPFGEDMARARAEIGWVSHESLCYGDLTGHQNVVLAAELQGLDPAEVWARAVDRFELGAFAKRAMRTNSRGQRQRVALARALAHHPTLILLDEPTTGLDHASTQRLMRIIEEEVARGAAVVVVTHEPQGFPPAVDRLSLERGRLVEAPSKGGS